MSVMVELEDGTVMEGLEVSGSFGRGRLSLEKGGGAQRHFHLDELLRIGGGVEAQLQSGEVARGAEAVRVGGRMSMLRIGDSTFDTSELVRIVEAPSGF